jgi:hypothetical protein
MSRSVFALLALIAGAVVLVLMPGTIAQIGHTPSVMLVGNSTTFTLEDANQSEVNYSAYDSIYGTSVHVSVITAQLYLNGMPYNQSNIPITFTSDNDSIAVLEPYNRTRPSDANGQAKILLISNNTIGYVNITASMDQYNGMLPPLTDTCTVRVVGWGTVSGMVTDKNQNGVPNAKMTLWVWNGTANVGIIRAPDNPQLTNDGSTAAIGTYTFTYVPAGVYNLTAEKDNHTYFAMVYLTVGTYTANVAFPDYIYTARIPPTVTPTPVPAVTPTPTPKPTPTPSPGFEAAFAIAAIGIGILASMRLAGRK